MGLVLVLILGVASGTVIGICTGVLFVVPKVKNIIRQYEEDRANQKQVNLNLCTSIERAYIELSRKLSDGEVEQLIDSKLRSILH